MREVIALAGVCGQLDRTTVGGDRAQERSKWARRWPRSIGQSVPWLRTPAMWRIWIAAWRPRRPISLLEWTARRWSSPLTMSDWSHERGFCSSRGMNSPSGLLRVGYRAAERWMRVARP